jgi:hypothetical protein
MVPLRCSRRLVLMPGDAFAIPGATPTAELHHDIVNLRRPYSMLICFSGRSPVINWLALPLRPTL